MVKIGYENNPLRNYNAYLYLIKFPFIFRFRMQFLAGRNASGGALEGVGFPALGGKAFREDWFPWVPEEVGQLAHSGLSG